MKCIVISLQCSAHSTLIRLLLEDLFAALGPQDCTANLIPGKTSYRCHLLPSDGDSMPKPFARSDVLRVRGFVLYGKLI